jgi:penicillin amidase
VASPDGDARRRWPLALGGTLGVLVLVGGGGGAWVRSQLRASLPQMAGERALPGLSAPVRVERDALGVPVVRGGSRADVARATGFLHAQERFFQMDLLRRSAAGELAALFGKVALEMDREARLVRPRLVARRAVEALGDEDRAILAAYTAGANAGLSALGAPPFEYLVLRADPVPWREEDSMLCVLAMYRDLQGRQPQQEALLGLLRDALPRPLVDFLAPVGTEWDAPIEGDAIPMPALPGPDVVDLRQAKPEAAAARAGPPPDPTVLAVLGRPVAAWSAHPDEDDALGSNNWAVAGTHTVHGGAIVADDMHLRIAVPNTWYRASFVYPGPDGEWRITGVTLPGVPLVVAGSNGRVAWGFTNSEGDWADLVLLDPMPGDPDAYPTPDGPRTLERATETIEVKGEKAETLAVESTVWGPVIDRDHTGRRRALAWVALREGGLRLVTAMELSRDLDEALALAPGIGIPHQNYVVADFEGRIGWTIIGRVPRRLGHDGRVPASWADGTNGWDGWLTAAEQPRVTDPPSGRLWTANARVVSGDRLAKVGVGGYDLGARQKQIRDGLFALAKASEDDMLRLQLDDRALLLARWQALLLDVLTPGALAADLRRAEARRLVEAWGARAAVDSAGYRIVRAFRERMRGLVLDPLLAPARARDAKRVPPGTAPNARWEGPVWAILSARPAHLLDPRFPSWDALLLAAADESIGELTKDGRALAAATWGERNTTLIQHPLSRALPWLAGSLDMPREPLPGDNHMPRFQAPSAGASERFAVSPGREEQGYFHMPCGQSGHPLSPHYADGHAAWAKGERAPFLPGPAVNVLTLVPGP